MPRSEGRCPVRVEKVWSRLQLGRAGGHIVLTDSSSVRVLYVGVVSVGGERPLGDGEGTRERENKDREENE
jgi:hypothetical protein